MESKHTAEKKLNKLNFVLSMIAILTIALTGTFLLKMQNADNSVIMQPVSDEPLEISETEPQQTALPQIININTATKEELMLLPGIGEAKAKSIIAYREQTPFKTPKDIVKVKGFGDKIYEALADKICVE